MKDEFQSSWKKVIMSLFKVLYWHLSGGLKKTTKNLGHESCLQAEIRTRGLLAGHSSTIFGKS
jgi:hypothetical protein